MIKVFVDRFMDNKHILKNKLSKQHPEEYKDLVKAVCDIITADEYEPYAIDPNIIHSIDDGDYQGTLVFVIPEKGYQPSTYYYVKISYGSCSGCDTLQSIRDDDYDNPPNDRQIKDYMTIALHIVQNLKMMGDGIV